MAAGDKAKYMKLVSVLRKDIIRNTYQPGSRLPTRLELAEKYGVSNTTIQKTFDMLMTDGFIKSRPSGTFVVDRPPHLYNYAILANTKGQWSRWFRSIHAAVGVIQADSGLRINEYLTSASVSVRRDVNRLCKDICDSCLSGLIFVSPHVLDDLEGTPALEQKGFPRVRGYFVPENEIPAVYMDVNVAFIKRAVEYLTSRGRRRIAHLRLVTDFSERKFVEKTLIESGVEFRPYWQQSVFAMSMHETVPNIITIMMQLDGDKRPDALIISDDNLIEHATVGLIASGVKIPEELEVVAHFNYPAPAITPLPMKRLGFDCRTYLRKCIDVLEMQRNGETPPAVTMIPPIFDDELGKEAFAFTGMDML